MKTHFKSLAGAAAVLITGTIWSCIRTEISNPTQIKSVRDSTEYMVPDTIAAKDSTEEEDSTEHPISFDVTVEGWEEHGDTIFVWI